MTQATGFFQGRLKHCRVRPKVHQFSYPYFCVWMNLDAQQQTAMERPEWFRRWPGLVRFRRQDYLGDANDNLADTVRTIAGFPAAPGNSVWLLGQLRYLGCYFSPINMYFIGEPEAFHTMVAEVSNTPWGEKHSYVVPLNQPGYRHRKQFQVSPFMAAEQHYQWWIDVATNHIKITIGSVENNQKMFQSLMSLSQRPLNQFTLPRVLMSSLGWMLSTRVRIYWQALKLWLKGVPFLGHQGWHGNQIKRKEGQP